MVKRFVVNKGSVFEVPLSNNSKGYFQFIMLDITMLNSEVIRVFKKRYSLDDSPSLDEIVRDEVEFYAHVMVRLGAKLNLWKKAGNSKLPDDIQEPYFRHSLDYGKPEFAILDGNTKPEKLVSERWEVWRVGQDSQYVGPLSREYREYDVGVVKAPIEIVTRMESGAYKYVYPGY